VDAPAVSRQRESRGTTTSPPQALPNVPTIGEFAPGYGATLISLTRWVPDDGTRVVASIADMSITAAP
jgi:hypothetical protein